MKNLLIISVLFLSGPAGCALFGETEPVVPADAGTPVDDAVLDADDGGCAEACLETLSVTPDPIALSTGARIDLEVVWRDENGDERPAEDVQIAVQPDGLVVVEGTSIVGDRVGTGTLSVLSEATSVEIPLSVTARWKAVATGFEHGCGILSGGDAYCWGQNARALGTGLDIDSIYAVPVDTALSFASICNLSEATLALDTVGDLHGWGRARDYEAGSNDWNGYKTPNKATTSAKFRSIDCGVGHGCGVTQENDVYCWGTNRLGEVDPMSAGDDSRPNSIRDQFPTPDMAFIDAAAGANHSCAVTRDGAVWCWGDNTLGQLGVADPSAGPTPVEVLPAEAGATEVTAGLDHTCALVADGAVECWGDNDLGQLGTASDPGHGSTVRLETDRPIASLAESVGNSTCALDSDGRVGCWGDNSRGQLGVGNSVQEPGTLVWLDNLGEVTEVSVGGDYACAVVRAGSIFCWGGNDRWQQGRWDGNQIYSPRPLPDPPGSLVIQVDPAGTYLLNAGANAPTIVELSEIGVSPGDLVDITAVNYFEQGDDMKDNERSLVGLFSSSSELLEPGERERVPGAIAAGEEFETDRNTPLGESTDISGDFEAVSVQVVVPEAAQFLFLAVDDSRFDDNEDPGGDFGARITVLPPLSN